MYKKSLKKSIIASIALICVGIIFGIVLVSSYNGIKWSFAGDTRIGAANPPAGNEVLKSMSEGFRNISKEINPKVVSIVVTTKPEKTSNQMRDFFKFFGEEYDMPEERQSQGSGSGVIISADGYILTNNHVVKDADKSGIEVTTFDRKSFKAKVVGTDKNTDLAVIKVDASDLPVAYLGNSDNVQVGDIVVAAGNPLGLNSTITNGIVSALGRNIGIINSESRTQGSNFSIENFIQTDAVINPGNSGGPLVDISGAVIGINTAIASNTGYYQGYGFAIPINLAKKVADDIIKYGKVKRGFLGISMDSRAVDETLAKALGLPKTTGVMVQGITSGGAAEAAGVQGGDVILEVDGKEVNSANEVQDIIGRKHPGDEVKMKFFREGKYLEKTMKLKENIDDASLADNDKSDSDNSDKSNLKSSVSFSNLGFGVRNLTAADKTKLKVSEGVVVENVKNYGYAQSRTLQNNDVITEVKKKGKDIKINNVNDLEKTIKDTKPGEALMLKTKSSIGFRFIAMEIPKE
jgi:serine protease Do